MCILNIIIFIIIKSINIKNIIINMEKIDLICRVKLRINITIIVVVIIVSKKSFKKLLLSSKKNHNFFLKD
jgi:hypothetical protein